MLAWLSCIISAYLIGSIPFGLLIAKAKGIDIRAHGSKNIGATNVGRVLGKRFGIMCFLLDALKGAVSVLAAGFLCGVINQEPAALKSLDMWLWMAVAVAAVAGHMASIFLKFAGGKGVATSFGGLLAMWPLLTFPALAAAVVWYAALRLSRYVSVSSMSAAISLPLWYLIRCIPNDGADVMGRIVHASPPLIVTSALALLVIWQHRANIARLRKGEEPKVGERDESRRSD